MSIETYSSNLTYLFKKYNNNKIILFYNLIVC